MSDTKNTNSSKETKGSKVGTTDSHLIGARQEYRRTGKAPDASDSSAKKGGKASTPKPW